MIGGNLTLAKSVFIEFHFGMMGEGSGYRGFTGISAERLTKRLNLPVSFMVGGEGFISNELTDGENASYWGGMGLRAVYEF